MIQSRARDGRVTLYGYDDLGRVEAVDRPGALPDLAMVYDHLGRRTQVTDGSGNGVGYGFDALGRPVRESRLVAGVERYRVDSRYDVGGRRDRVAHGDGFALTYGWRPDGLPLRVAEDGAVSGPGVLATYGYDAQGRLDRVDRGNGVVSRYGYDGSNRLTALGHDAAGTGGDMALGFTYGAAGEILTRALDNSAYAAPLPAAGDVAGVADALNRLSAVGGVAINHDAAGRVTADGVATYGYDEAGRLVSVIPVGGGAAVGLSYDVLGRLSRVAVAGQAAVNLAYDGLDVVAELDDAGAILRRYAHGAGADNVLASYDGAGTGNRRWLLADERGSVIAGTDGAGAVSGINAYDEFGIPAPGNSGLFQYTGQVRIPGTGLYHYKARAYHPGLGRFLQPDPMGYADGVNLYAYVGNDPINLVDPLGLESEAIHEIIVTATRPTVNVSGGLSQGASSPYGTDDSGRGGPQETVMLEEIVVTGKKETKTKNDNICQRLPSTSKVLSNDQVQSVIREAMRRSLRRAPKIGPLEHGFMVDSMTMTIGPMFTSNLRSRILKPDMKNPMGRPFTNGMTGTSSLVLIHTHPTSVPTELSNSDTKFANSNWVAIVAVDRAFNAVCYAPVK